MRRTPPPPTPTPPLRPANKYQWLIRSCDPAGPNRPLGPVDVYAVLAAFEVTCPATAHAVKKLLCAGIRRAGQPRATDLREAQQALDRAIDMAAEADSTADTLETE